MISRERVMLALNHKEGDRIPIHDHPWHHTVHRWRAEGLPQDKSPADYFGYEIDTHNPDWSFQLPQEILEETDKYTMYKDPNGATMRSFKDHASTPEHIDFSLTNRLAWEELKPRMVWTDTRVAWEKELERNRLAYEAGKFICLTGIFGFDKWQAIVGTTQLLVAMIDDPEWVKDMFDTAVDVIIDGCDDMISRGFKFDGAWMYDDLGYRNATFFSPSLYREIEFPPHHRLCNYFKNKNMPVILHSCGRIYEFVPMLIEAGFTCLQPVEAKSGMDLVQLKKEFGDAVAWMGGIDVRAMAHPDFKVIEREIRTKIPVAKKGGGYIYHSDHSVPSNVSFGQYCRTIELVRKYGTF